MVIHNLTMAIRHSGRVALLHHGTIAADGPNAEVLTAKRLASRRSLAAHRGLIYGLEYIFPETVRPGCR